MVSYICWIMDAKMMYRILFLHDGRLCKLCAIAARASCTNAFVTMQRACHAFASKLNFDLYESGEATRSRLVFACLTQRSNLADSIDSKQGLGYAR